MQPIHVDKILHAMYISKAAQRTFFYLYIADIKKYMNVFFHDRQE